MPKRPDKVWLRSKAKLPCSVWLFFFLAQEIGGKLCNAANIRLLPVMNHPKLHIRLDNEALCSIRELPLPLILQQSP
jgi:hypothetical protein